MDELSNNEKKKGTGKAQKAPFGLNIVWYPNTLDTLLQQVGDDQQLPSEALHFLETVDLIGQRSKIYNLCSTCSEII